jgi:ATP-binding cassette subfamily C protein LapB
LLGFVDDGRVKLALPEAAGGTEIVPLAPLQAQYAGYAIFAKAEFRFDARAGDLRPRAGPQWFWGTLARFRPIYGHVVMASVVINLLALASPLFVMNVYDRVVPNAAMETLWALVFGVLIVVIFEFAIRVLRSYFVDLAGKNADVIIANDLLRQIMGLRLGAAPPSTGALINTLREFESVREFFTSGSLVALVDLPFVLLFVGIVAAIGGPLALVPLIAIPLVMGVGYALQFPLIRLVQESYREAAQKNALLVEAIEGLDAVKTCGGEGRVLALWEQLVGRTAETARQARLIATLSTTASLTIVQLSGIAVVVWGAYRIADGDMTMGSLVACTILVGRSLAPLGAMAAMLTRLQQSRVALAGLDALMQAPTERPVEKSFVARPRLNGDLEFRQVSFRYPGQQQAALDAVSFRLKAGERLGIIGRVGSGKSTIARLILGLYEPTAGAILVDGVDIRQVDPIDLRRNIGSVGQDSVLFFGSVRDNIAYGAPHVDDATVERAARLAGVSEFVRTHPRGYDLPVGERGTALSGGQRQSIAIARALLLDPPVLLLDEPTSSLDNSAEATLKRRLADIAPGKTMVLITHRSSLLPLVDRLLIMDGGKIVADGPRDEVLLALRDGQVRATAWA